MSEVYFKDINHIKGPVLGLLKKQGYQAVDMHYHSKFSVDGLSPIKSVIDKCKKENVGTSFTDHNHIEGSLQGLQFAKKNVFVIPGIELTCHNGVHVLLHFADVKEYQEFYHKDMKKRITTNPWFLDIDHVQAIEMARDWNCLITTPHPYGPGFCGIHKFGIDSAVLRKVDAVEVLNGCCKGEMNPKAIAWARKVGKGFTGGSDGHCLQEHGNALTLCQAETREQFLEEIRQKRSIVIGKEEGLLEDGINGAEKFIREEIKAPKKQLENMWKDRGMLEWDYLKTKVFGMHFLHHYRSHHTEMSSEKIAMHPHTKHLVKYLKKKQ